MILLPPFVIIPYRKPSGLNSTQTKGVERIYFLVLVKEKKVFLGIIWNTTNLPKYQRKKLCFQFAFRMTLTNFSFSELALKTK